MAAQAAARAFAQKMTSLTAEVRNANQETEQREPPGWWTTRRRGTICARGQLALHSNSNLILQHPAASCSIRSASGRPEPAGPTALVLFQRGCFHGEGTTRLSPD